MPKLHPRERIVNKAELELYEWERKHNLTRGELLMIFSQRLASSAKYQIRYERHGNEQKEGGLE